MNSNATLEYVNKELTFGNAAVYKNCLEQAATSKLG
jgi:hypothetical protein